MGTELNMRRADAMTIETAREITAACARTAFSTMMGEYVPLPKHSLLEMLQANDMVAADRAVLADGTEIVLARCAPRIIAACYAYEQYGRSGGDLLEAVGLTGRKDAMQDRIAALEADARMLAVQRDRAHHGEDLLRARLKDSLTERDALKKRVAELEAQLREAMTYDQFSDL